ncbi:hypothetical protein GJAV_G00274180 [Gymnothorax javanicus]|nr:hypothetical protein GJAV_G00274180 [Gymnothorax javanicus]
MTSGSTGVKESEPNCFRPCEDVLYGWNHVSDVLAYIHENLVEPQYSCYGNDYGKACLTTAVRLLDKICKGVKSVGYKQELAKIPMTCMNMVALVSDFFLCCQPQVGTEDVIARKDAKIRELLVVAMGIMRNWVNQTLRGRLTTGVFSSSFTSEIEVRKRGKIA